MRHLSIRRSIVSLLGVAAALAWPAAADAAPAAPSSLTAVYRNGTDLTWVDNSTDETAFVVERCFGAGCTSFGRIATVAAGVTSFTDTFAPTGTDRYRVLALGATGTSTPTNVAEISIISTGEIFPRLSASVLSGTAPLTVAFDASSSTSLNGTVSSYVWSFGDDQTGSGALVSHTFTTPGVYAATVDVAGGPFNSTASTSVNITVTAPAPPPPPALVAPTDLTATSPARARVQLAWTNPTSSATSLVLQRCKGSSCTNFARIATLTTSTTSYLDTTVSRGTAYRYRLVASNSSGAVTSNIVSVVARR
jgi:PKD repeat protein